MSPETYLGAQEWTSDVREVVDRYYAALRGRDRAALKELLDERFAPDVVVHEPPLVPFGGDYEGTAAVEQLLVALTAPDSPLDVERLAVGDVVESVGEPDRLDHVVARLTVPRPHGPDSPALAWWTFKNLRVAEIRTFYWA